MKANVRRSYLSLPKREKDAMDAAIVKYVDDEIGHAQAELQKIWLQLACIILHDAFGMGPRRLTTFLGNWKRIYKRNSKLGTKKAQDEFLKAEMERIFGKDGYPYEFIDSL